jgi:glycosyltransferase involved in cell wall biosynthesis
VVASNLQGLRDAVLDGKTGHLVSPGDPWGFVDSITLMGLKKESVRATVHETFNWTTIGSRYYEVLTEGGPL